MSKTIIIDPITRIEGHLKIEVEIEDGQVTDAKSSGTLFRGIEIILKGRDPRDAVHITQRVCGVCPIAHARASALCLDDAFGVTPPRNAHIIRDLMQGANFIMSHILHFYHLAALDYVLGPETPPFVPRYEGDYRLPKDVNDAAVEHYKQALEMRMRAHEMLIIFGGKMPHVMTFAPGGVTEKPDDDKIAYFSSILKELRKFIEEIYIPDVLAVAGAYQDYFAIGVGCKNLVAYGWVNPHGEGELFKANAVYTDGQIRPLEPAKITEDVRYSWFSDRTTGRNPLDGATEPEQSGILKPGAYSWLKSPRYDGQVHEVGPLARMLTTYLTEANPRVKELIDSVLAKFNLTVDALFSVMGRHAARALECQLVAEAIEEWLTYLVPGEPVWAEHEVPMEAEGMGLAEAPRGALGHWIRIENFRIKNYQIVSPTNWNASPRDDQGKMGPIEQALIGTPVKDPENPIEVVRVVRSFDPCLACAVHLVSAKKDLGPFKIN